MALSGIEAQVRELVAASASDGEGAGVKTGDLFADDLPSPISTAVQEAAQERGRGRPEGSRNRGSEDVVKYLQATRRSPLLALQDVVDLGPLGIAREFGMKVAEAAEFWRKCAAELLPYVAKRQPQAVELPPGASALPVLALLSVPVDPRLAAGNPPAAGDGALDVTDFREVQQDQVLSLEPLPPCTRPAPWAAVSLPGLARPVA